MPISTTTEPAPLAYDDLPAGAIFRMNYATGYDIGIKVASQDLRGRNVVFVRPYMWLDGSAGSLRDQGFRIYECGEKVKVTHLETIDGWEAP